MSRIGYQPIAVPSGVDIEQTKGLLKVSGQRGSLTQAVHPAIRFVLEEGVLRVERKTDQKQHKALHGLFRSLAFNMVKGVSEGYTSSLTLIGVGFKASHSGQVLELHLGYSHPIYMEIPSEIKVRTEVPKGAGGGGKSHPIIVLEGADKQLLGQVVSKIRSLRKIEPYKGKGICFVGEKIRRKPGKAAKKA